MHDVYDAYDAYDEYDVYDAYDAYDGRNRGRVHGGCICMMHAA